MRHVFISYVRENSEEVDRLAGALRDYGITVWLDRHDIRPGERWERALHKAIEDGDFFIACFSKEYWSRDKSFMSQELRWALEEMRKLSLDRIWFVPVLLSECEVPDFSVEGLETLKDFQWVELYKNWDEGLRRIIGVIDPEGVRVKELIGTLEDRDAPIVDRINAAQDLGRMGPMAAGAAPALTEALFDPNTTLHQIALEALVLIGKPAVPALREALKRSLKSTYYDWVRRSVAEALVKIGEPAVPALAEALKDEDREVRSSAAKALGEIGESAVSAVPALAEALKDKGREVRWSAAEALGKIGEPAAAAVPALVEALKDEEELVRQSAAEALGQIGEPAVPALVEALKDGGWSVRSNAAEALGKIGKLAVPGLIGALKDEDSSVRSSAAEALGEIGEPAAAAVPALAEALEDENSWVREVAAEALRRIGTPEARRALEQHRK